MCSHSTVLLVLLLQHRALLNPLVEDRNGWFGVRLLHVLEQARRAEDLAAEGAKLRVYVAYRGSAIVAFLLGSFFAKIANRRRGSQKSREDLASSLWGVV